MLPYRPLVVDNRPAQAVFMDSNPLTDGMHNFAASLINAPMAADQIRQQKAQQELHNLWQQHSMDRQDQADQINRLWHEQGQTRQAEQDAIARANMGLPVDGRTDLQPLVDEATQTRDLNQQYRGAQADALKQQAFWNSPLGKMIGGLFNNKGGKAAPGAKPPHIQIMEDADGNKKPYTLGADGQFHEVPIAGAPVAEQAPVQGSTGWPGAAVVGAGAAGAGAAYGLAKRGAGQVAAKGAAPVAANTAGRVGQLFAKVPGGATVARALPMVGRGAAALASAPVAALTIGGTAAYQANQATRADLNPVEGDHMAVLKAYADGKSIEPGMMTKFGKAITTRPGWMGGSSEPTGQALDRIQGQHVQELTQALATAIPEGDPNKARILQQIQLDAYQNPQRAQQLVATIYQQLVARSAQMQPQAAPVSVAGDDTTDE